MDSVSVKRRTLFRVSATGAAVIAVLSTASFCEAASPNLIVIMADDLGAHELGCYGHPKHETPHLDRMAEGGMAFATCYSTPICHPTRFEIMTGQYGHHNGVYQFAGRPGGPKPNDRAEQIVNHVTFAHLLRKAGYATCHAGKWQLTGEHPTLVREAGFDEYCMWAYKHNLPSGVEHTGGWEGKVGGKTSRYWHPSIVQNGEYVPTTIDDYGPDLFADFVIDFARRHRDEPFFVYYPMALTHAPYYPTPTSWREGMDKFGHSRDNWRDNVEYMDAVVGRIVDAIEAMDLGNETIILFTGDNGTGGDGKGRPTERGCRVPLICYGPGVVKATAMRQELVDLSDVLPTLLDFAGAARPSDLVIDGRSFAPLLEGEPHTSRAWIYAYLGGRRVVRTPRWLLENNSPRDFGQLFDCGENRDGTGYVDVTESDDAEVLDARRMMEKILADKPVPRVGRARQAAVPDAEPRPTEADGEGDESPVPTLAGPW